MTGWRRSAPGPPPPGGPSAGWPTSAATTGYARALDLPGLRWSPGPSWRWMSSWPVSGAATTAPCSWWWRRWPPTAGSGRSGTREVFTAVLRTIPTYAAWLDVMDPITGVFPMAGLHNTLRRLVADGTPVATGLHAIGDSVCTTNPTLGRGLALALSGAADLADTIGKHAADPAAQALALDRLVGAHVRAVLPGPGRDRRRAAGDDAAHHLRRAAAAAVRDSRPGHLPAAARGRVLRPDRLPRVLEDQRHDLPARARSTPTRTSSRARRKPSGGTAAAPPVAQPTRGAAPHRPGPVARGQTSTGRAADRSGPLLAGQVNCRAVPRYRESPCSSPPTPTPADGC